jgi:ethanolamine utilization microcompartment shell protein EutL
MTGPIIIIGFDQALKCIFDELFEAVLNKLENTLSTPSGQHAQQTFILAQVLTRVRCNLSNCASLNSAADKATPALQN